jgi:hypothetical protein
LEIRLWDKFLPVFAKEPTKCHVQNGHIVNSDNELCWYNNYSCLIKKILYNKSLFRSFCLIFVNLIVK